LNKINIEIIYEERVYKIETQSNAYASLMMLISNQIADEEFGDCRGMGKCGTCLIEILSGGDSLVDLERNEATTLSKMNIKEQNIRLSCQLLLDENLDGLKIRIL
jgi:2Fe-2S ferredoxin